MSRYNFAPRVSGSGVTAPGGVLSPGNNVLTFAVIPLGVNGTDINHYLLISGGTGALEACLINGGTGNRRPAGADHDQLRAFAFRRMECPSATSGFQETKIAAGPNSVIFMPGGTWPFYAPGYIDCALQVIGAGRNSTYRPVAVLDAGRIRRSHAQPRRRADSRHIQGFRSLFYGHADRGKHDQHHGGLRSIQPAERDSEHLVRGTVYRPQSHQCGYFTVADCEFHGSSTTNTYIQSANPGNNDAGDSIIQRNWFFLGGTAINYLSGAGLRILDNKFLSNQIGVNVNWANCQWEPGFH